MIRIRNRRVKFSRVLKAKHKKTALGGDGETSLRPAVIEKSEMKEEAQLILLGPIDRGTSF
jgi:predicted metal-dependent peptidase